MKTGAIGVRVSGDEEAIRAVENALLAARSASTKRAVALQLEILRAYLPWFRSMQDLDEPMVERVHQICTDTVAAAAALVAMMTARCLTTDETAMRLVLETFESMYRAAIAVTPLREEPHG